MYSFKLSNGQKIDHVELDGYMIAGLVLDAITISIHMDDNGKIQASLKESDKPLLEGIDYQPYLKDAESISADYIKNKELEFFLTPYDMVIDIVDNNDRSYYQKIIPKMKQTIHLKVHAICSETLLDKMKFKQHLQFDKKIT